jgi:2-pyrone-4,6-dicarboxylate lactonase
MVGSCDSHVHIFGSFNKYSLRDDRRFTANEAPETALRRLHAHFGFARSVVV